MTSFSLLHAQVKWWNTINEPTMLAMGYSVPFGDESNIRLAPYIHAPEHGRYLAIHTVLLSHARAYRLYEREFKGKQGGEYCAL